MSGAVAAIHISPAVRTLANGNASQELVISPAAKKCYDLSQLKWQVCGMVPYLWKIDHLVDIHNAPDAEIAPIAAHVPGSVQKALLDAGILRDWNVALNARDAEWVENRDWIYQAELPDDWIGEGKQIWLRCAGLDYRGCILLNGVAILPFKGSFTPYEIDLKPFLKPKHNLLQIWLQPPPRWMGESGYTSEITEWKPRFNYYWDWTSRMVQAGIWDRITLDVVSVGEILRANCTSEAEPDAKQGSLRGCAT